MSSCFVAKFFYLFNIWWSLYHWFSC